jgi:hypothetical protein
MEQHIVRLSETVRFLIERAAHPDAPFPAGVRPGHVPVPLDPSAGRGHRRTAVAVAVGVAAAIAATAVALLVSRGGDDVATPPATTFGEGTIETSAPTVPATPPPSTPPNTTTPPTTTTLPPLGLEEVARFSPFDLDPTDQHVPDPITGIDIADHVLAFANGIDGVTRVSITSPDTPMAMVTYSVDGAQAVEIDGDLIYAIGGGPGNWRFEVFDTDGLGAAGVAITGTNSSDLDDLEVADGFAYVSGWNYIGIIDVTDPSDPRIVLDWSPDGSTGNPAHAVIDGTTGYFGAGWDGLYVFDLADPAAPALLDHWISPNWVIDIAVADGIAYVTLGDTGLAVLDVSDPSDVRQLGAVEIPGFASMVDIDGTHVFVGWFGSATAPGGIVAIDATDPVLPIVAGSFGEFANLTDLQVGAGHVFVSDQSEDLVVFRITEGATTGDQ